MDSMLPSIWNPAENYLIEVLAIAKARAKVLRNNASRDEIENLVNELCLLTNGMHYCTVFATKNHINLKDYRNDINGIHDDLENTKSILKYRQAKPFNLKSLEPILNVCDEIDEVLKSIGLRPIIRPLANVLIKTVIAVKYYIEPKPLHPSLPRATLIDTFQPRIALTDSPKLIESPIRIPLDNQKKRNSKDARHYFQYNTKLGQEDAKEKLKNLTCLRHKNISKKKVSLTQGLIIDKGAIEAIQRGANLYPIGILETVGSFDSGYPIGIYDKNRIKVAEGTALYSSSDIERIKGRHSSAITKILGFGVYTGESVVKEILLLT